MIDLEKRDEPRLIVIVGPTGVGKSASSIEWAERLGGEIISADSMQVYRYMDIGTAKPTWADRKRVRHHLIDVVTPDQPFHAGLYRALGRKTIDELHKRKTPIWVVGGTGLYVKVLTQGLFASPRIDPSVRERLREEAERAGSEVLYERLREVDPKSAERLHPNDLVRIIRALEVFDSTGVPLSFYQEQHRFGERPYRTLKIGLEMDREALYRRIDERVDRMIEEGFREEVKGLLEMGYGAELKPMMALGYKEMVYHLLGELSWSETIRLIKRNTRHYAKRQWTWFRADPEVRWCDVKRERQKIVSLIKSFLTETS